MTKINIKQILVLLCLSYLFFILGNGIVSLTNPDEVFYAQTAKEMARLNSWMTPYLFDSPQFEKPILLFWLLRIAFIIFGISSFSARLFPALFASLGVIAVYLLSLIGFRDEKKAFISSLILMSSGIYIGLARTVFTDMIFSIFILFSLLSFYWGYSLKKRKGPGIFLFFIFAGFAVLTKGPLGFIIPFLIISIFLLIKKDLRYLFSKFFIWGILVFILISFPWYILMFRKYGHPFTHEFFYNDHIRRLLEAEHLTNDTWYFYPISMILGMFPWSIYVIFSLFYLLKKLRGGARPIHIFLACWVAIVFLIFQPAHSKLASYIFPLFPALAILAADFLFSERNTRSLFYVSLASAIILVIISIGLGIASTVFSSLILKYLSSKITVYILFSFSSILAISFFTLVIRRNFLKSIYVLASFFLVFFCIIPLIEKDIEPFLSSKDPCAYLLDNYKVDNTILCSKFFARGVRYYTDKEIAIMAPYGKDFFSPHPVTFLGSDELVNEFLLKQPVTYCVFKKSSIEDMERQKDFKIELLKVIGNEYILKVVPRD